MSTHHDDQDLLGQALRERAEGMTGSVGFDAVKDRARGIRRRRNAVRGTVAAVVLAVAVPVGLSTTDLLGSQGTPAPPAASRGGDATPSPTKPAPTPRPDGTFPLTVAGLPLGGPAGLPYLRGEASQLVTPQETVRLPEPYVAVTPYDGGYLAVGSTEYPGQVLVLDSDLDVTRTDPAGGDTLTVSQDGSRVAYVVRETDTKVMLVNAPTDGSDPVTWTIDVPSGESLDAVGFLDNDTVVYNSPAADVMGFARAGGDPTPITGLLRVDDASEATGLVSGLVSYGVDGGCSGVMDPATGELRWQSCDHSKLRFSPDGRHVIADASYYDGPGSPTLSVLDTSTGDEVATFSPERGARIVVGVMQAAWEDDGTVLAYVEEGRDQAMLRLGLDGSTERVSEVFTVRDMVVKLWFAEQPR